jgi:hypothetical protein
MSKDIKLFESLSVWTSTCLHRIAFVTTFTCPSSSFPCCIQAKFWFFLKTKHDNHLLLVLFYLDLCLGIPTMLFQQVQRMLILFTVNFVCEWEKNQSYQMPNFWRWNNDWINRFLNRWKFSQSIAVLLDRKTLYG